MRMGLIPLMEECVKKWTMMAVCTHIIHHVPAQADGLHAMARGKSGLENLVLMPVVKRYMSDVPADHHIHTLVREQMKDHQEHIVKIQLPERGIMPDAARFVRTALIKVQQIGGLKKYIRGARKRMAVVVPLTVTLFILMERAVQVYNQAKRLWELLSIQQIE